MGAIKRLTNIAQQAPKGGSQPNSSKKDDSKLKETFHAFGDWITSPSGIITILAIVGLVLYINHKTAKK